MQCANIRAVNELISQQFDEPMLKQLGEHETNANRTQAERERLLALIMTHISPETALDYLLASGISNEEILRLSGISRATLYSHLRKRRNGETLLFRNPAAERLVRAYHIRRAQVEADRAARKELGL